MTGCQYLDTAKTKALELEASGDRAAAISEMVGALSDVGCHYSEIAALLVELRSTPGGLRVWLATLHLDGD